ncbi:hypothetical protein SALBM135S_07069 [Streptomyces alboniger]
MATAASTTASVPASIGDSEFDRDTAVTRREPGVYDIDLSAGWTIINAVNGELSPGRHRPRPRRRPAARRPRFTVSAHYLTASSPGPAVIRTDVVRVGRTLSTGQASLLQYDDEGREIERIRVLASYGDLAALPEDVRTTAEPPVLPPLDQCFGAQDAPGHRPVPGSSAIADRLFLKLDPATLGWALGQPSGKGEMRGWFGLADGRDSRTVSAACRLLSASSTSATPQLGRVTEVPVEGGGGHAHGAGDLAQAQAAEALLGEELQRGVHERLPGLLLLGLPDAEGVTHAMQLTTVLRVWEAREASTLEVSEQLLLQAFTDPTLRVVTASVQRIERDLMLFLVAALLLLGVAMGSVAHAPLPVTLVAAAVIGVWLVIFAIRERSRARHH